MIFIRQLFKGQLSVFLSLRLAIIIVIANAAVVGLLGTFMYYVLAVFGWPIPTSNQLSQNEFMLGAICNLFVSFLLIYRHYRHQSNASLANGLIIALFNGGIIVGLCLWMGMLAFIMNLFFFIISILMPMTCVLAIALSKRQPSAIAKQTQLTDREKEVMHLVQQGLSNKQIADQLFISESTVKSHLKQIFKELNITSRFQLIRMK